MAITTTTNTIFDGNRTASMQFTGISDGSGALTGATLIDPAQMSPPAKAVKIKRIIGSVSYGIVELYWDALPPVKFAELSGDYVDYDYERSGSLTSKLAGPDATGKVLISTIGFSQNSTYQLKLDVTKSYRNQIVVA